MHSSARAPEKSRTRSPDGPRLKGKDVGIPVRKLGLAYGPDMPTYWFANNAFLTSYFSGFSATLPDGEAQFIHSVRLFKDKITDPVLQAQIRGFIGQEVHHAKEHEAFNAAMVARGIPLDVIERFVVGMNEWVREHQHPVAQLASTVCAEHITALLADYLLTKNPELLERMAPEVRPMWAWHAIEESEHKAVAFDVYEQLVGKPEILHRTMVIMTVVFIGISSVSAFRVMPRKELVRLSMWKEALSTLGDLAKRSWPEYLAFYEPGFHPWQHDNREAIRKARRTYLGEAV